MNPFIVPEIAHARQQLVNARFPLRRSEELREVFARTFSRHLGGLQGAGRFETESILVTGESGSGKTREITYLLEEFNRSGAVLPNGLPARFVCCTLDSKGGWKDLGKKTLHALGYPISGKSRATQTEIWERVVLQAKAQGVVGIHYDEAQHILRGKSENDRLATLDSFKSLMKSHDWPLMLILSGVPELAGYIKEEPQLFRLVTQVRFAEVDLKEEISVVHEIVGNYALKGGVTVSEEIIDEDFYRRLVTAGAYRWGLVIELTSKAVQMALARGASELGVEHFVEVWVEKTNMNRVATPFTHDRYETMFRRDAPFQASIAS
ncbi:ATP-binding protein [Halovulum sp. GXIMD14794]